MSESLRLRYFWTALIYVLLGSRVLTKNTNILDVISVKIGPDYFPRSSIWMRRVRSETLLRKRGFIRAWQKYLPDTCSCGPYFVPLRNKYLPP